VTKRDAPKLPRWKDETGLVAFVNQAIIDLLNDPEDISKYGLKQWPFEDRGIGIVTWEMLESEAVDAAEGGNYAPLAKLFDPKHPLNHPDIKPPICASLTPKTYALVFDILSGRKKPAHRPKLTDIERRAINPIHDAADEVPVVERMLHTWYPDQTANEIYNRTLYVVAHRHQVRPETLAAHLKRSRGDRRRLRP
jgi:hypothetical protein